MGIIYAMITLTLELPEALSAEQEQLDDIDWALNAGRHE